MNPNSAESLKLLTYNDYVAIDDNNRYEAIDGELHMMAKPSLGHQRLVGEIAYQLLNGLEGKKCKALISPLDVRLFYKEDGSDLTYVQPDVLVICDKSKMGEEAIHGAPDLVVEVVSPTSKLLDVTTKKDLYLRVGVKEYWVVGYDLIRVYLLENDTYNMTVYNIEQEIPVTILPDCIIHLERIIKEIRLDMINWKAE
jgi:Uma2 family endonuclease